MSSDVRIMFQNHKCMNKAWCTRLESKLCALQTDNDVNSPVSERVQLGEDGIEHPLRLR